MIANKYKIGNGKGKSKDHLVSFDLALMSSGVGNYNLVRLSSILPAHSVLEDDIDLEEGSLLPTAYSTISSSVPGEKIVSTIGIGFPNNKDHVGVIMEYSEKGISMKDAMDHLSDMIAEAFKNRGWELDYIRSSGSEAVVEEEGMTYTTFAYVSEW